MKGAPGLFCLILYHFGLLAGQVVDDFACDDKPGHGGDVGGAARHLAALGALAGGAQRADAVLAANPHSFAYASRAFQELANVYVKGQAASGELAEFTEVALQMGSAFSMSSEAAVSGISAIGNSAKDAGL